MNGNNNVSPLLPDSGVILDGAKQNFKFRTVNGERGIVAKRGARGTMRQEPRQATGKKQRSKVKRRNQHAKVALRLEPKGVKRELRGMAQAFNMKPGEAWEAFAN